MTPQQLKELAEFGAEFLGKHRTNPDSDLGTWSAMPLVGYLWPNYMYGCPDSLLPTLFFEHEYTAPILAHLAKREMEKRGVCMQSISLKKLDEIDLDGNITKKGYLYKFDFALDNNPWKADYNENECIALWLAIRDAVKP